MSIITLGSKGDREEKLTIWDVYLLENQTYQKEKGK